MKTALQRIAALAVLAGVPFSWSDAVAEQHSTACLALTARVAKALNLKKSSNGDAANIGYASLVPQGAGTRIRFACPLHGKPTLLVTFNYPAEYPPSSFYDQLALAGEILTGAAGERIRLQAHRCHRAAKRAQGRAHKRAEGARIDCIRAAKSSTFWIGGDGKRQELSAPIKMQPHAWILPAVRTRALG